MRLLVSLLLIGCSLSAQTAITAISSFWEMDMNATDQIAWDAVGNRHAKFVGKGLRLTLPANIFGSGVKINTTDTSMAGVSVPTALINASGTFCYGVWARHAGSATLITRNTGVTGQSWNLNFNATSGGRPQAGGVLASSTYAFAQNSPVLVWFCYDAGANQIKLSINDKVWYNGTPTAAFQAQPNAPLNIASSRQQFGLGATVGRMMYWDGYIPTDVERAAIWNAGAGRDITYFKPAGYTPPAAPVSFSLANTNFISDQPLTVDGVTTPGLAEQGLYYFRPWKLLDYSPSLAATYGNYMWFRSTDHTGAAGGIWMAFSSGPSVAPGPWTKIIDDDTLSADDPAADWSGCETPHVVWNPTTSLFHLYGHCVKKGSPYPYQQTTHVWTSPNLTTWTWRGIALPNYVGVGGGFESGYNHSGYAIVDRRGAGDWTAVSIVRDGTVSCGTALCGSLVGIWASADGLTWTLSSTTTGLEPTLSGNGYLGRFRFNHFGGRTYLGNVSNSRTMYIGLESATPFVMAWPPYSSFEHDGTGTSPDFLQHVAIYEESGTVYAYAKWAYQQTANSHIRLYTGTIGGGPPPPPSDKWQYTVSPAGVTALTYDGASVLGTSPSVSAGATANFGGTSVALTCSGSSSSSSFTQTCNPGSPGSSTFTYTVTGAGTDTLGIQACVTNSDTLARTLGVFNAGNQILTIDVTGATLSRDAVTSGTVGTIGDEASVAKMWSYPTFSIAGYTTTFGSIAFAFDTSSIRLALPQPASGTNVVGVGETKCNTIDIKYGAAGATIAALAADGYAAYNAAYPQFAWPDRRPIGAIFMADGTATATNPRAWKVGTDYLGAGFPTARAAWITQLNTQITNAGAMTPKPQALILWDIEGCEGAHPWCYVGYPGDDTGSNLTALAPEMENTSVSGLALADDAIARIKAAGYRPGLTLRPHRKQLSGSGPPVTTCYGQSSTYDSTSYLDTSISGFPRGYRCQIINITFDDVNDRVSCAGQAAQCSLFIDGPVRFYASSGSLPASLNSSTTYYLRNFNDGGDYAEVYTADGGVGRVTDLAASGAFTMEAWRGPVGWTGHEAAYDYDDALSITRQQIRYAMNRWGVKVFYQDSTFYKTDSPLGRSNKDIAIQMLCTLRSDFPDVLIIPENAQSTSCQSKYLNGSTQGYSRSDVRKRLHSSHFNVAKIDTPYTSDSSAQSTVRSEAAQGQVYLVAVNSVSSSFNQLESDLIASYSAMNSVSANIQGSPMRFQNNAYTGYSYPVIMRVYFAENQSGLATSNSYCTKLDVDKCFLNGEEQPTPSLSADFTHYQLRYYDFSGALVSSPGSYGVIR